MNNRPETTAPRKIPIIPAGSILRLSENGLCDYDVRGVFRAEKDIDAEALRAAWLQAHPEQARGYGFSEDQFVAWVVEHGFLAELKSYEWFLCQNGQAETMDVFAPSAKRPPGDSAEWLASVAKGYGMPVVYAEIPLRTAFVGESVSDYESYYTRTEPDLIVQEMRAAQMRGEDGPEGATSESEPEGTRYETAYADRARVLNSLRWALKDIATEDEIAVMTAQEALRLVADYLGKGRPTSPS